MILRGKSLELVYLRIHNEVVEISDAAYLQGKGVIEAAELARQDLNKPKAQVATIGMAGENSLYFTPIEQGRFRTSRGGICAVRCGLWPPNFLARSIIVITETWMPFLRRRSRKAFSILASTSADSFRDVDRL